MKACQDGKQKSLFSLASLEFRGRQNQMIGVASGEFAKKDKVVFKLADDQRIVAAKVDTDDGLYPCRLSFLLFTN